MAGKLRVTGDDLTALVRDLEKMEQGLEERVRKLNSVVDSVEGHWKGVAAGAYNNLQREVNMDVRRVKELLTFTKEAVAASRDGFDQEESERLNSFKGVGDGGSSGILGHFQPS
ncbi:WXG100 family type VII secretion target [Streptomyces sp. B1866]|uniref:WXG100 family type VII secretion target n=1 Tax=Streptomyces sp. B1866 TaxID=3075431 RepID=UPI00288DDB86|nr:WXG100 family type VII secretion target [Streptomyces sp. B1866]MDT3398191.1 WXG100 family type VII secretion target [Streptomyces sp. B1866]